MKAAFAVGWKLGHPQGIQFFDSIEAVRLTSFDPASLVMVGGFYCKWPAALGPPPDDATVAMWITEYDGYVASLPTEPDTFTKREQAILIAAALLGGANPAQAKAQAKAKFQQAMGLLP